MANTCPHCGASLIGDPIPDAIRVQYGMATHWRREIGVYDQRTDRTIAWRCPECEGSWPVKESH